MIATSGVRKVTLSRVRCTQKSRAFEGSLKTGLALTGMILPVADLKAEHRTTLEVGAAARYEATDSPLPIEPANTVAGWQSLPTNKPSAPARLVESNVRTGLAERRTREAQGVAAGRGDEVARRRQPKGKGITMAHYKYLIIGGGMTADAAVQGIRDVDSEGTIGLIGADPDPPYDRPPLTKGLWKGKPFDGIWRRTQDRNVELHLGRRAEALDVESKQITDDQGHTHTFERLLLATGGQPRRLPFGAGHIIYFRTAEDYRHLRALAEKGKRFAVIGGGFIGSEIAAGLAMNDVQVVMVFPESGIGARTYPRELSDFVTGYYRDKGVEVLPGESIESLEREAEQSVLTTSGKRRIVVDGVVAGIGIEPDVELAKQAGLKVDNGIVVDEFLRTSDSDIYAAGDVAGFHNPALGKRLRVEHEDNANTMGKQAGRNMAGQNDPYHHLPYFYSDLFELGYEAVGEMDARLETFSDWKEPFQKGVVYYLEQGRVRGVLLWNVWDQVPAARELIAEPGPFGPDDLHGRLPHVLQSASR